MTISLHRHLAETAYILASAPFGVCSFIRKFDRGLKRTLVRIQLNSSAVSELSAKKLGNFTHINNPSFTRATRCSMHSAYARRISMSKLMFAFLLLCSLVIYNPESARDFAAQHANEIGSQAKQMLYALDRMMPSFMRFSRG
jgi:hypothetical protein